MATHRTSDEDIVVQSHRAINKAREAHGLKHHPYLMPGVPLCSRKCIVANALGIRNRVDGVDVAVRSKRSADRLSEVWGTKIYRAPKDYWTNKDFKWVVRLPEELSELARRFDQKLDDSIFTHCATL